MKHLVEAIAKLPAAVVSSWADWSPFDPRDRRARNSL